MRRGPFFRALVLLFAALAPIAAAPAQAGPAQESIMQDDRVLTFEGEQRQLAALDEMRALGVDTVRTVVNWRRVSPSPDAKAPPDGFDPADPASYPAAGWDPYDALVRNASARGIAVLMTASGPIPDWASKCGENVNQACRPNAKLYRGFVTALAKRYGGSHADESGGGALPRVSRWSLWNEPNLASWLYPQKKGKRAVGPRLYRRLARVGIAALRGNGHSRDQILLGETAPLGSGPNMAPEPFWLTLLCAKGARRDPSCKKAKRLRVTGIAHHPYTRGGGEPLLSKPRPGAITFANLGRLDRALRRGVRRGTLSRRPPLWLTEFGVTSNPPDPRFGVPLARQAEALNQAGYLAYRNRRVRGLAQFAYEDDTGLSNRSTFQTGLKFGEGTPKAPTLSAYRLPLYVLKRRAGGVRVFGQVRPADRGERVEIQRRGKSKGAWRTVKTVGTRRRGFLMTRVNRRGGTWRLRWGAPGDGAFFSRAATVARASGRPGRRPPSGGFMQDGSPAPAPAASYMLRVSFVREANVLGTPGAGSVSIEPGGLRCEADCEQSYTQITDVTLTAVPAEGSEFAGWSGEDCSGIGQCHVRLLRARHVTATFRRTAVP